MDKYYTPDIEEFHVGFEFESNYVLFNNTGRGSEWKKIILDDDQFGWFYSAYTNDAVDSEFRVKYLDKEDIESLGFTLISNVNGFSTFKRGEHILRLFIKDSNEYTIEDPGNIVFQGIIKNKSELKKLLKQLNIK